MESTKTYLEILACRVGFQPATQPLLDSKLITQLVTFQQHATVYWRLAAGIPDPTNTYLDVQLFVIDDKARLYQLPGKLLHMAEQTGVKLCIDQAMSITESKNIRDYLTTQLRNQRRKTAVVLQQQPL